MSTYDTDTIIAPATPPGRGGIGVIRLSGPKAKFILQTITGKIPEPRRACYASFKSSLGDIIDKGLVLYFPAPHSFTGEDVVEFHGHGGPVVIDLLMQSILQLGCRLANPGEFSERAFLNEKMDLIQAEAIADLINSHSAEAARSAIRSLQGKFSEKINSLKTELIHLRMYVEAAIDFPEEEIDFLNDGVVAQQLKNLTLNTQSILKQAKQGTLLREGLTIVLAGRPNAGKSTLLNALSGQESAIVTDIPGTTRDIMREQIVIDGLPIHVLDTAGLRNSDNLVEQEGIRRAYDAMKKADHIFLIMDYQHKEEMIVLEQEIKQQISNDIPMSFIFNKIDLKKESARIEKSRIIYLSAKTGEGIELFRDYLKAKAGYLSEEGIFTARRRHLDALQQVLQFLTTGEEQLQCHRAGELLAEDLKQAQHALSKITGEFTSEDLLGEIFSNFCIGK